MSHYFLIQASLKSRCSKYYKSFKSFVSLKIQNNFNKHHATQKRSAIVSNYKLVFLKHCCQKCFDEKQCYRNEIKRWRVVLQSSSKGNIVCPPESLYWASGEATVLRGRPTYGRTGKELVHERCPEKEKKSTDLFTFDISNDATM